MSENYVNAKIHEALQATDGDKRDSQKLLITWAVRDPTLLLGLTKPHLKAIVAAQLEHVMEEGEKPVPEKGSAAQLSKKDISAIVAGKPLGEKRSNIAPPKTSIRQASVMHQLADAFKKKK